MSKITMLGTGHATVTHYYNTCFTIQTAHSLLLVDAGGGNGILGQLQKAHIDIENIHHIFVTHAHTDHILGVVWVLRMVATSPSYKGTCHLYSHDKVLAVLRTITRMTFSAKNLSAVKQRVIFHEMKENDKITAGDIHLQCFDIHSTKEKQYGFRAVLPSDQLADNKSLTIACLGDEPFNEQNRSYVEHADWLLCEAFCLYADKDRYKPYEKCHSTALDAGKLASELQVGHLLLYHTEDHSLGNRRERYTQEAARYFKGEIVVPDDLETIPL